MPTTNAYDCARCKDSGIQDNGGRYGRVFCECPTGRDEKRAYYEKQLLTCDHHSVVHGRCLGCNHHVAISYLPSERIVVLGEYLG